MVRPSQVRHDSGLLSPLSSMTTRQIELVRQTFRHVTPIADHAAALFYARLFELDPTLRPLIRGDLRTQGRKLMQTLALAVTTLDRLGTLLPIVRQLGVRQASYGVQDHHYGAVGNALLWTLRQGLGAAFTEEVESAWAAAYALVTDTMRAAAATTKAA